MTTNCISLTIKELRIIDACCKLYFEKMIFENNTEMTGSFKVQNFHATRLNTVQPAIVKTHPHSNVITLKTLEGKSCIFIKIIKISMDWNPRIHAP